MDDGGGDFGGGYEDDIGGGHEEDIGGDCVVDVSGQVDTVEEDAGGGSAHISRSEERYHDDSGNQEPAYENDGSGGGGASLSNEGGNIGDRSYGGEAEIGNGAEDENIANSDNLNRDEVDGYDNSRFREDSRSVGASYDDRDSYTLELEHRGEFDRGDSRDANRHEEMEIEAREGRRETSGFGISGAEAVIVCGDCRSRYCEGECGRNREHRNHGSRDRRYIQAVAYQGGGRSGGGGRGVDNSQGRRYRTQQTTNSYPSSYSQYPANSSENHPQHKCLRTCSIISIILAVVLIGTGIALLSMASAGLAQYISLEGTFRILGGISLAVGIILLLIGFVAINKYHIYNSPSKQRVIVVPAPQQTARYRSQQSPNRNVRSQTSSPRANNYQRRGTDATCPPFNPGYSATTPSQDNGTPYPSRNDGPPYLPQDNGSHYPPQGKGSHYPPQDNGSLYRSHDNRSPYPSHDKSSHYPPQDNGSLYRSRNNVSPYLPQDKSSHYPPQDNGSLYRSHDNRSPYPSHDKGSHYPPQENGSLYRSRNNVSPYPSHDNRSPYPSHNTDLPYLPPQTIDSNIPPSYNQIVKKY